MEKKATIFSLIFVAVVVISAVCYIVFAGITAKELNYVQLEINPRVEILCDKNFKVVSFRPLNEDAKIILTGIEYKGMNIEDACVDFMDTCAKAGYIDVDGEDNAINITIIDGITQALDSRVTRNIYKYCKKNEIMCAVVENYEVRKTFDEKKENQICCSNKYKLIKTIQEYMPDKTVDELKKLSEEKLIDMIGNIHQDEKFTPTEEHITLKTKLIDFNREKYDKHMKNINDKTQQEFAEKFDKFQKNEAQKYFTDYNKEYDLWQNSHVS